MTASAASHTPARDSVFARLAHAVQRLPPSSLKGEVPSIAPAEYERRVVGFFDRQLLGEAAS